MTKAAEAAESNRPDDFLRLGARIRKEVAAAPDALPMIARRHGLRLRKAYYLIQIARAFEGLPVPRARLLSIGWSKLGLISERVDSSNFAELLDLAEQHPAHRLNEALKGGEANVEMHTVLLHLTPEQYAIFRKVLVAHGAQAKMTGLSNKEKALTDALVRLIEPKDKLDDADDSGHRD